jgi:hypothetical protein
MNKIFLILTLIASPAFAQTMYKCPSPTPGAPPIFQQAPCTPQGGGETVAVKKLPGSGTGLSEEGRAYLTEQTAARHEQERIAVEEAQRREALNVERGKATAQQETARAIDRQTAVLAAPRVITIRRR